MQLAGIAAQSLAVDVPRGAATVRELVLLATTALAALHGTETGADVLGGRHLAQVQPHFAMLAAADVGHPGGDGHSASQRQAQARHRRRLAIETVIAALVAASSLQEPLHAAVGPVAALLEGDVLRAYQHAIFKDAQADDVAAEWKIPGVERVDASLQVERLQQALAIESIHARIACQQHGQWRSPHHGIGINIRLGGTHAHALETIQRQHAETEGTAQRTGQVAPVHAPQLQIMLGAEIVAIIGVVQLESIAACEVAAALVAEVPFSGQVSALEQAQRARPLCRQCLVVPASAEVQQLLVQEGIFGRAGDLMEAIDGALGGDPLAGHEQAHGAFALVVQRTHGGGIDGRIEITAASSGAAVTAGQMTVARQWPRQRRQQRGLCVWRQFQRLQHLRWRGQLHAVQRHLYR